MTYKSHLFEVGKDYTKELIGRLPKEVDRYFEPIINKVKLNNKKSAKVEEVEDKDNLRCKKKFEIYFIIKEIK